MASADFLERLAAVEAKYEQEQSERTTIKDDLKQLNLQVAEVKSELAKIKNQLGATQTSDGDASDDASSKKVKGKKLKKPKASKESDSGVEETPKKKKVSGYLLHNKLKREDAKAQLVAEAGPDEKISQKQIMSKLGEMWKALSDEERADYNDKAKSEAEAYASVDAVEVAVDAA